jgi:hypothetical protein
MKQNEPPEDDQVSNNELFAVMKTLLMSVNGIQSGMKTLREDTLELKLEVTSLKSMVSDIKEKQDA